MSNTRHHRTQRESRRRQDANSPRCPRLAHLTLCGSVKRATNRWARRRARQVTRYAARTDQGRQDAA